MLATNKIVIAVTGEPPDSVHQAHGDYVAMMAAAVGEAWQGGYQRFDARDGLPPADTLACAGVIVTGSAANVPTREPWIVATERWLAALVEGGMPVLGVCFGHQLLAQALGGEVGAHPGGQEMSTVLVDRLLDDPLLHGLPSRFHANACHGDTVVALPPGASVLARNEHDAHQSLRFAARCYGVQFHPEFDGAIMRDFVDARADLLLGEGRDPAAHRARASDTPDSRRIMANFVRYVMKAS